MEDINGKYELCDSLPRIANTLGRDLVIKEIKIPFANNLKTISFDDYDTIVSRNEWSNDW